jgi:hypothetical protein
MLGASLAVAQGDSGKSSGSADKSAQTTKASNNKKTAKKAPAKKAKDTKAKKDATPAK